MTTAGQQAVIGLGLCGELLDEGRFICILQASQPHTHTDTEPILLEEVGLQQSDLSLLDLVAASVRRLPEVNATSGRDYGRGYAQAIRDVLELVEGPGLQRH